MNSICFFEDEIIDLDTISFEDAKRLGHVLAHLKSKVSDQVIITILNNGIYTAVITELSPRSCSLKIKQRIERSKMPWLHLLIGLSRPQTVKKVLEHASTLGVASFDLFTAALSEKSYGSSKIYEDQNFQQFMVDGISQSKLFYKLPKFSIEKYLSLDKYTDHKNKFFLSLNTQTIFRCLEPSQLIDPLLAIGPERGWTKDEERKLLEAGFTPIKVSESTLRVEHAIYTAIGQLEMLKF